MLNAGGIIFYNKILSKTRILPNMMTAVEARDTKLDLEDFKGSRSATLFIFRNLQRFPSRAHGKH